MIEPGCLALTHKCRIPANNGLVVAVELYVGDLSLSSRLGPWTNITGHRLWKIDREMKWRLVRQHLAGTDEYDLMLPYAPEAGLLRLDDPDIQAELEAEERTNKKPDEVTVTRRAPHTARCAPSGSDAMTRIIQNLDQLSMRNWPNKNAHLTA